MASLGDPRVLASLRGVRYSTEISSGTGLHAIRMDSTQTRIYPDSLALTTRLSDGGESHLEASPERAFRQVSGGPKVDLPTGIRDELIKTVRRDRFFIGQNIGNGNVRVTEAGMERIAGADAAILRLEIAGANVTWYVSPADGRLVRTVAQVPSATGMVDAVVDYSDWRICDGLTIPFQHAVIEGGKNASLEKVIAVELIFAPGPNEGIITGRTETAVPGQAEPPANVEPFGFKAGMTKEQVLASVGKGALEKDDGDVLVLSIAPRPHADFGTYLVCISQSTGLAKVGGISKDVKTSAYGDALKDKFSEFQTALESKYGKAKKVYDFLRAGSTWNEPQYWMIGLLKQERTRAAFWELGPGMTIQEEAVASSLESGYVRVEYEFPNFQVWSQEHKLKKDSPF